MSDLAPVAYPRRGKTKESERRRDRAAERDRNTKESRTTKQTAQNIWGNFNSHPVRTQTPTVLVYGVHSLQNHTTALHTLFHQRFIRRLQ